MTTEDRTTLSPALETTLDDDPERLDRDFVELETISGGTKGNLSGKFWDGIALNRWG